MSKTTLFDSRIRKYAYREAAQIYKDIGASPDGLSTEQVDAMQEKYGANSFAGRKNDTTLRRLRRAFINPFNVILFILGIISLVTDVFLASDFSKNASTAIIIFSMILISGTIRLIQELRAKNAAQQLDRLIHESITVRRSGELLEIPAEKLVVGDVVLLSAGDRVPADIRLTKVTDLFVSQAAITGESAILEKSSRTLGYGSPETLTQLANLAFMATTVISGKGEGIVLAVGKDTLYGSFTKPDAEEKTSFQQGANSIAWVMLRFIAVLIPFVFILLGITGGKWLQSFAFALSVAVGLMPEMLPMVITACLARGSLSMSRKQTIIKDINAMQGFGSMDVLCMDKTGTLTNESILLEYYMDVLGNESGEVLDLAFLNSIYHSGVRNPIDNAIRACQTMPGREVHFAQLLAGHQKADEIPFDYARKIVSTLVTAPNGENQLIMKGDIAHVVSRCGYVAYRGKVLPMEDAKESVSSVVDEMLQDGMKVIAVARKNVGQQNQINPADEADMILVGYLAFFDAPKKTAKVSIEALKRLKVTPKILTGDQTDVAVSICRRVGIPSETVLTGGELDKMTDSELSAAVESVHVFSELTPGQKVRLVSALEQNGHIHDYDDLGRYYIEELDVMQVPEHLQNYIDYEAYGRDVALEENGTFTDQGYVWDTGSSFHEFYDGERGSIPDEYRVMTFQDDLPEEEKSEWAMDIAFDMDEFFRQRDPQYAAEHPEAHAAKEEVYENLMAGRISALDEKLAALGQTQEDYLPSEIEKFKDATGYEEFLDFDPAEIKAALENPDKSRIDEMLAFAEKAEREYAAEAAAYVQTPADIAEQAQAVPRDTFSIYQLKSGNETLDYHHACSDFLRRV